MSLPFFLTWQAQSGGTPVAITGGKGAYFNTSDGRSFLDLGSLSYQANLGHGHPRMVDAVCRQAQSLCLAPPSADFPVKRQLAEGLLSLAGLDDGKVFFTLGGAEAIENAMKIAKLVTGRHKFISRSRSYHGATLGALSLTGDFRRPPLEPLLSGIMRVDDDAEIPNAIAADGDVAAVVLESVVGANGVYETPAATWREIADSCRENGTLLIADEVLTGFGRCGKAFAIEHVGVEPDIICCAKGLTAGYAPLGAVLVRSEIANWFENRVLYAGLTNYAHPLGCAAGLEALNIYRDENLFDRAAALGPQLLSALKSLSAEWNRAANPRGRGLLAAVDIDGDNTVFSRLSSELSQRGISLHLSPLRKLLIIAPPLNIDDAELQGGLDSLLEACKTI